MFRMSKECFDKLHNVLTSTYGLQSTRKMSSVEALAMFLWMCASAQSARQADNRFCRSLETVSRKFDKVLCSVSRLAADIIRPKDPQFSTVHPRVLLPRFYPYFNDCIGALDGSHIKVIVPTSKVVQHTGRHGYTSQNVLAVCDFDMRFTFVVAGWPGSVHDNRVLKDALEKYKDKFPHPPEGKFYLVDAGYPNRPGFLAPYKGTKYHFQEYRQGPPLRGKREVFNHAHSSLRNVIERAFGVLKQKWRILKDLPSYPMEKQSDIIIALMALHNFVRENDALDDEFLRCDQDDNYIPSGVEVSASQRTEHTMVQHCEEDETMNQFRDRIADGLYGRM